MTPVPMTKLPNSSGHSTAGNGDWARETGEDVLTEDK
jgi:hypothetical protein